MNKTAPKQKPRHPKLSRLKGLMSEYEITLSRIEKERQAEKDKATELIQNEEDLRKAIADIDKNYDTQRSQAIKEQIQEEKDKTKKIYDDEADLFVNLATGTQDITDLFQDMGKQILKNWISTLLQMNAKTQSSGILNILSQFLGFFTGGTSATTSAATTTTVNGTNINFPAATMHTGGIVEPIIRAHTGMLLNDLKSDEVPIIGQTGERMLSRNQNEDITGIIKDIKAGNIEGKQNITNNYWTVQTMDSQSFASFAAKNHEGIAGALGINYQSNGLSRKIIKGGT
jgi:hypothetical protein